MKTTFNDFLNENSNNELIDLWNNYAELVDIIDGIISEHGELSDSYWQTNVENDLDLITNQDITPEYIERNKEEIIKNFKELWDGLIGWSSAGNSIERYGSLKGIKKSLFGL